MEQHECLAHTEIWVKDVIMKYNICQFARTEVASARHRYVAI